MLVAGAGGHAKDIVASFDNIDDELVFFDDQSKPSSENFLEEFPLINSIDEAEEYFTKKNNEFIIGVGGCLARKKIFKKLVLIGGNVATYKDSTSKISTICVRLGIGLNIMPYVFISSNVEIGDGTLLNTNSALHHDVRVGKFCDIAPGAILLGGVRVGDLTLIGANSTILPDVKIGNNCLIGTGAVVTSDIPDNTCVMGIPARKVKDLSPNKINEK